jgi:hypothetical protein
MRPKLKFVDYDGIKSDGLLNGQADRYWKQSCGSMLEPTRMEPGERCERTDWPFCTLPCGMTLLTAPDGPASPTHLPMAPGPDGALADGLLQVATRDRLIDDIFIRTRTSGHSAARRLSASPVHGPPTSSAPPT